MSAHTTHRTRWAAIGAAVAVTLGAVGIGGLNIANADISAGDRPIFVQINPCRLLDTRPGALNVGPKTSPLGPEEVLTVTAHGANGECTGASEIPTDASGLSLNVTAIRPTSNTFLTFWGDGPNPGTSNLNPRQGGDPTPNAVNTPVSATGTFNIYNDRGNVDIAVDVNGYYAPHDHDDRYIPRARLATSFVVSAGVSSSGGLFAEGDLPDGVRMTATRTGTGSYSVSFDNTESLGLTSAESIPKMMVTPRASSGIACILPGGGSTQNPDGVWTNFSRTVRCYDAANTLTDVGFNFILMI